MNLMEILKFIYQIEKSPMRLRRDFSKL